MVIHSTLNVSLDSINFSSSCNTCRDPSWWKELDDDAELEIKYPHERHGLAGKISNSAKTAVLDQFLLFVDINSQTNGRPIDSYSTQFYFISKFTRIVPPKKNDPNYSDVAKRSVISVFNAIQGKDTVGDSTARGWLQTYRPKVAVHPQYTDYCDKCKQMKEDLARNKAIKKRLIQSGNSTEAELRQIEDVMKELKEKKQRHASDAAIAREFYKDSIKRCQQQVIRVKKLVGLPPPHSNYLHVFFRFRRAFAKLITLFGASAHEF